MNLNDAFHFLGLNELSTEDERFAAYQEMRARLEDKLVKAPTEGLKQKYQAGLVQMDEAIEAVENQVDEKDLPPIGSRAGTVPRPNVQESAALPEPPGQDGPPPGDSAPSPIEESERIPVHRSVFWVLCLASLAGATYFGNEIWGQDQGGWNWVGLLGLGFFGLAFGMEATPDKSHSTQPTSSEIGALVQHTQQAGVLLAASTSLMFFWIATWLVDSLAEFKLVAGCSAAALFLWGCYRLPSDESYGEDKERVEALASNNKSVAFGKTVVLLAVWGALVYGLGAHKWTGETVVGAYETAKGWVSESVVDPNTDTPGTVDLEATGGAVSKSIRSNAAAPTKSSRAIAGANGSASNLYTVFRAGHERGFDDVAEADQDAFAAAILNDDRNFGERDTVWTYQSTVIEIPFRVSTQKPGTDLGNINQAMVNVHQASQVMESKDRDKIKSWEWKVLRKKEVDEFNIVRYFWTREAAENWRKARQLQTFYPAAPPSL
ncbi:MAG: hypothetical protein ACI9F9_002479 [Candidatus Paceibacteria bacterium]|jgi:hypothetical protein